MGHPSRGTCPAVRDWGPVSFFLPEFPGEQAAARDLGSGGRQPLEIVPAETRIDDRHPENAMALALRFRVAS
jgi:hypothetical protein